MLRVYERIGLHPDTNEWLLCRDFINRLGSGYARRISVAITKKSRSASDRARPV
jgi:hypothetical protein